MPFLKSAAKVRRIIIQINENEGAVEKLPAETRNAVNVKNNATSVKTL